MFFLKMVSTLPLELQYSIFSHLTFIELLNLQPVFPNEISQFLKHRTPLKLLNKPDLKFGDEQRISWLKQIQKEWNSIQDVGDLNGVKMCSKGVEITLEDDGLTEVRQHVVNRICRCKAEGERCRPMTRREMYFNYFEHIRYTLLRFCFSLVLRELILRVERRNLMIILIDDDEE